MTLQQRFPWLCLLFLLMGRALGDSGDFRSASSASSLSFFSRRQELQRPGLTGGAAPFSLSSCSRLRAGARENWNSRVTVPSSRGRQPYGSSSNSMNQQQQQQYSAQQQQIVPAYSSSTAEGTKEMMDEFLTRQSRNTFISRVYLILASQLVITVGSILWFGTHHQLVRRWMTTPRSLGAAVPGLSLLLSTVAWFIMNMSETARRASPLKWQLLALFTAGEAVSVGFLTSFFRLQSVVTAMMATAGATTAVSLYTILNRNADYDLSQWGATLSSAGLIFLGLGMIQLLQVTGVIPRGFLPINDAIYSFFGATLFSFYLAYHTKLIVSGKHTKYQMSDKDYVFGAMSLYNDIISMFIYILRILGQERDD